MNAKKIVIDGKTYNSIEEMPADIRQKYELAMRALGDANGNRIPDLFEKGNVLADQNQNGVPDIVENLVAGQAAVSSLKIIVDGKEYNGLEGLPPEARAKYEAAMSKLDANKNGIPDFMEGMTKTVDPIVTSSAAFPVDPPLSSQSIPTNPAIAPETSNGLMLVLAALFIFLVCVLAGGAVWYFFLR